MPALYLLDTNSASYIIKGNPARVRERLLKVPMAQIAISAITEAELRFGAVRKPEFSRVAIVVDEFLMRVESIPWNSDAARQYALLRAVLEREGEPLGSMDLMIAAHALALEAVLVTGDLSFRRVKRLKIEDWSKP